MQENPISNQPTEIGAVEPLNTTRASSRSSLRYGPLRYAVVDVEIGLTDHRIHDIGALRYDGAIFHKASKEELLHFLERGSTSADTTSSTTMPNTSSRINRFPGGWSTRFTSRPCSFPNVPIIGL